MEPRVQLEYLPEPNVILNERATNILEDAEERVKIEREFTEIEKEVDSNHSFNATTNEGRESDLARNLLPDADNSLDENLLQEKYNFHEYLDTDSAYEQNLLQDTDVDNSLDENLLQEINNSHEYLDNDLLQGTDSAYEQNLLQDTDVDNSSDKNLLQEINNPQREIIETS